MDDIEKWFATLNELIVKPGTAGIPAAEKAVDELLETASTEEARVALLLKVQKKLAKFATDGSNKQSDFVKLVQDFIDFRMRELQARTRNDDPSTS
jgi:hypothetical protein